MFPWYKGSNASRAKQSPSGNHVTKSTVLGHSNLPRHLSREPKTDQGVGSILRRFVGMPYWFMGLILWFSSGAHSFRMRGRRPRTIAVSLDVRIGSKAPF